MSNTTNSSSSLTILHHLLIETPNASTTSIWIINERDLTPLNIDTHQPFVRIMWYRFLLVIIISVTAAGNTLVCLAIARERKLQNTTNYFLMSLAIADCLVAVLVMPMGMIAEVLGHFPLPHYACIIFATMDVLCCTSSIWHMSTMSMDRYFTIRFPFRYGRNKTRRIMLLKIIAVWAISVAVSSPVFVLGIVKKENVLINGICAPNHGSFKIYGSIFAFYIPFIIMITTYALTMRSLRNVLVTKKKYNLERRRKQTFRPLAQIISQYTEIAQGIRRSSASSKKQSISITTTTTTTNNNNSILNKTPFTIITTTTTSPADSRTQLLSTSNTNINLQQDNNSMNMTNGANIHNEIMHHNSQHLTTSYIKPIGIKQRRYQQQALNMNTCLNRTKNECDMSTVYEITEYSKSTSSSHDVSATTGNNNHRRRSIVINEQPPSEVIDKIEQTQIADTTTSVIRDESACEDEEISSISDLDIIGNVSESVYMQISSSPHSTESIFLTIPLKYYFNIIHYILQYYIFFFSYRLSPLSIEYPSNMNSESVKFHQSTSTSSIDVISINNHRSVSTQTNTHPQLGFTNIHSNETGYKSPKRRKFPFNRPTSSLFTNLFRQPPINPLRSSESSTKSSLSWGQRSSAASSSNHIRQYPSNHYSSDISRRIESEMDAVLANERRSRASISSSSLLHTTYRHGNHTSKNYPNRSAYAHSSRQPHQQLSSTTNTASSDSSSMIYRHHPKLFSTISNQQRIRDEDIVAANERKALRVLMIIFCVFVTLWTPFFICTFISAICDQCRERISSTVWFWITWLGYSSSMANPFIYTIFSDVFRRAFINIIFCRSNESFISGPLITKLTDLKGNARKYPHPHLSYRRSPNHDVSGTSTPIQLHRPTPIDGSDATIYINRCASDAFR